ncbi:group-specific protein [Bacillus sp. FJAT-49736]|uniref:group-specific protein n=1 Tax=Bacillus sp. FJAT-49736 TaxID=2833582 RepID=UPI001BC90D73|nr:group-specific protein [Bacillus sp. FJAT-49736]MBS4175632.1 group-specific protein [Bacillus sp. FJAT-49736]
MKFYIASSFQNVETVRNLSRKLVEIGMQQTYDWTQNERTSAEEELRKIGVKEKEAVLESDIFILVLPGGKGSHTELGIAIGSRVGRIYIFSPGSVSGQETLATTFYHLPEVEIVHGSVGDLVELLIKN